MLAKVSNQRLTARLDKRALGLHKTGLKRITYQLAQTVMHRGIAEQHGWTKLFLFLRTQGHIGGETGVVFQYGQNVCVACNGERAVFFFLENRVVRAQHRPALVGRFRQFWCCLTHVLRPKSVCGD